MKWYVIQPFYRRWRDLVQTLDKAALPYMLPNQYRSTTTSALSAPRDVDVPPFDVYQLDVKATPILPMVFVYASERDLPSIRTIAYEFGRLLIDGSKKTWQPLTIPDDQILRFMRALALNARYDIIEDRPEAFAKGDQVKVVDGDMYVGLEGVICRIKHDRHLIVRINGVCAISTSYVPQAFIVRKGDPRYDSIKIVTPHFELAELAYYIRTLTGLCREQSVGRNQIDTTIRLLSETRKLVVHSNPLAIRLDLTSERLDNMIVRLQALTAHADATDRSMPIDCKIALDLCDNLKRNYDIA